MRLDDIDLTRSELYRGGFPHDVFTQLREEAPVWRHPETDGFADTCGEGFWVLSRYEDIQSVNRAADRFLSNKGPGLGYEGTGLMLTDMDGQAHIRQRKLISSGFTPRMTRRLEDLAREWAARIVEQALERETVEFVQEVAYQLPMHMIADILGIPNEDRDWLFATTNDMLLCVDPEHPVPVEQRESLSRSIFEYGQKITARKRANPEDDVLSLLATVSDDQGPLNELELDAFFMLVTVAGSETTRNAISSGLQQLLAQPDQLDALRGDPGLMKGATEEIIRWSSPVAYFKRVVARDTEIAGVPVYEGEKVTLWYPSGNRDAAAFDDPYRFDIHRKTNEHIAFGGGGPHFCLGAWLARLELDVLFGEMAARGMGVRMTTEPVRTPSNFVHGIISVGMEPVPLGA